MIFLQFIYFLVYFPGLGYSIWSLGPNSKALILVPVSTPFTNICIILLSAKVYPRQQHTTRVTTEPSHTAVYLPSSHRNSAQNVPVTSVTAAGLATTGSGDHVIRTGAGGDSRVQHPQQAGAMPQGHYPTMPYYLPPELGKLTL